MTRKFFESLAYLIGAGVIGMIGFSIRMLFHMD